MIGYNCKYAPVEILAGFSEESKLINNEVANFDYTSSRIHPNMCSHAKAMLEEIHTGNYSELLFMNCCDSSKRIFNSSKDENVHFSYCIDLPFCNTYCAVERFKDDIIEHMNSTVM